MTSRKNKKYGTCVACGKCLSFCPVLLATLKEEFSPKAKNQLFKAIENNDINLDKKLVKKLAEMCVACGRCTEACAQGLSVPDQLAELRQKHKSWEQYLWDLWISKGDMLWPALGTVGKALGERHGKDRLSAIRAMSPNLNTKPWIRIKSFDRSGLGKKAIFFAGCTANRVRKEWVNKSSFLLRELGYEQTICKLQCCSGTLLSAGLVDSAIKSMKTNIDSWRLANRPLIVTACSSCHYNLANYTEYEDLFGSQSEMEVWDSSICNLTSLWGDSTFETFALPASIRWHSPCHGLQYKDDYNWLKKWTNGSITTPEEPACCGLGGVIQLTNHKLSMTISNKCWDSLLEQKAVQIVTGCSGCTIQLTSTKSPGVEVVHWLDILEIPKFSSRDQDHSDEIKDLPIY